jgi:hypothetical protein
MERRLFNDGGYYEANGATLCEKHHMEAEQTVLTCDAVRRAAKIREICLPEHLDSNRNYDKWGNQVINDNLRYAGELFYEEPVQKILGSVDLLKIFPPYIKYPRTQHLPFSENLQNNDRKIPNLDAFQGKEVVVTEKLDGEGTSCYRDYIHARSIDSKNHPSRNWMKAFHATFKNDIPEGWRVCGELLYARHSIAYDNLDTYFYVFNIWNDRNICLSWDDTITYADLLGLRTVPVLYRGMWDEAKIRQLEQTMDFERQEGYVVRLAEAIPYTEWGNKAAKFVRTKHVQTDIHWSRTWVPNKLRTK